MSITITDTYDDTIEVSARDHGRCEDGDISIVVTEGGSALAEVWLTTEQARDLVVAIESEAGISTPTSYPAGAVRASDISYNEAVLRLAAAHNRTVEFSYSKGDGSIIERRRLIPESLREVKGHLTFTGYDPDRDDVRAYRLDRINGEVAL